jgi:[ribosomal protein S5]-alanine N-acetyltransferase
MTLILSGRLRIRSLTQDDVTEGYALWLNDPEVNRYLESRFTVQTVESCRQYVRDAEADPSAHLFGLFDRHSGKHIGNIKIVVVSTVHRSGEIGLFIGEKSYWGLGFATEAIGALTKWCFESLSLEKIEAGCYDENLASVRAFLKSGYTVEGYRRNSYLCGARRVGAFRLGISRGESAST